MSLKNIVLETCKLIMLLYYQCTVNYKNVAQPLWSISANCNCKYNCKCKQTAEVKLCKGEGLLKVILFHEGYRNLNFGLD